MARILTSDFAKEALPKARPMWLSRFAQWVLAKRGWQAEGEIANREKLVIAVAPHTSNWDFIIGVFVLFTLRLKISFFGKHTLFYPPLGWFMRMIGGIPVERSRAHGLVQDIASKIKQEDKLVMAIAPEGTRKAVFPWRKGFLQIAKHAEVAVQLIGFDYRRKTIIFGPVLEVLDDVDESMQQVYAFYAAVEAKFPESCKVKE